MFHSMQVQIKCLTGLSSVNSSSHLALAQGVTSCMYPKGTCRKHSSIPTNYRLQLLLFTISRHQHFRHAFTPQWGAADAEIKVPAVEKTELEGSPFKAWGRSVYIATHATLTARDFFCVFARGVISCASLIAPSYIFQCL